MNPEESGALSNEQLLAAVQEEGQFAGDLIDRMAELARKDPAFFLSYVMRDEQSGKMIELAPTHEAWQDLITKHDRLIIWAHVEAGKSVGISIGRVLYEIGLNPNIRACVLSNTQGQSKKLVRAIAQHIEHSDAYKRAFPHIRPGEQWTETMLSVQRPNISKDPTVQATGVHGSIHGARIDLLIIDDILDYENTRTQKAREETWNWIQATTFGRLTEHSRVIVVGNAFHPEDVLHKLAKLPGWQAMRYPVLDLKGRPRWPERWPLERIEKRREELTPMEFARQMMCVAHDDAESRFKREWIDTCLRRGMDKTLTHALQSVPPGFRTITGVDLAIEKHSSSDLTVLFTICVHPNGDREVLNIESGKWAGPDIVDKVVDTHNRYKSLIIIENNAAQKYLQQYTEQRGIPVRGHTTTSRKHHPEYGVEGIAMELSRGQWIIPCKGGAHKEVQAWIDELLYYEPAAHTGDRLMASYMAVNGIRMGELKAETGRLRLAR